MLPTRTDEHMTIVDHPVLKRDLTILRDKNTSHGKFRKTLQNAATILAYEAMRDVQVDEIQVDTPLEETTGYVLGEELIVVPILRAGLGLVDGFIRFLPEVRVGHLGMQRDERTKEPVDYYSNIPGGIEKARVYVVDPMLATGGSAAQALHHLKNRNIQRLVFVCLVAAPEGIETLESAHPDVPIYTAAVDRELDENAFIRPGLGDAGDRTFGT